jgi:hypothetical protein
MHFIQEQRQIQASLTALTMLKAIIAPQSVAAMCVRAPVRSRQQRQSSPVLNPPSASEFALFNQKVSTVP